MFAGEGRIGQECMGWWGYLSRAFVVASLISEERLWEWEELVKKFYGSEGDWSRSCEGADRVAQECLLITSNLLYPVT